jgi:DnaJ-class molecular chaperone
VKAAYQAMSRIYHPDKHNSGFTGMSDEQAVEFFQHLKMQQLFTRDNVTNTEERKKYERRVL